jgi:hypothetical protein
MAAPLTPAVRPLYALTHTESAAELKTKKRAKKAANIQFRKRRSRRKATKVETERAAVESYEQRKGAPMMTLEAALIDLDPVVRAIIIARSRSERQ